MKMRHFLSFRSFALLLIALGTVGLARAQYELKVSPYSRGFQGTKPDGLNPPTFTPQFAGQSVSMGASIVVSIETVGSTVTPVRPSGGSIRLLRSSFGGVVAPGVPRYAMGDVILLPDAPNGVANYWRAEPVRPGETFSGVGTLKVAANFVPAYYYSPHAGRVFASQSGPVEITWVTRGPVVVNGESTPRFEFYSESFAVTAATKKPVRTLYWTERSFTAPTLTVPSGKIDQINPVFNRAFPATVSQEYQGASGAPASAAGQPEEKRTVWFDRFAGISQLHAYNREGRLMIEYLGPQQPDAVGNVYPFIGADIVDVIRVSEPVDYAVKLGNKLTARNKVGAILPGDGTADWIAKPLTTTNLDGVSPYGSLTRRDGVTDYYAERENLLPERVAFYWMEKADAGIHFLPAPTAPNLGLLWPKIRNHYAQIWSPELSDYAHNTVGPNGSTVATGIQFPGGQLPQVVFQDDPAQSEATIDTLSQRLVVTFGSGSDGFNRALLKFSAAYEVWYVPLYTQAENRPVSIAVTNGGAGYIAAPTVSFGAGVTATAVATITGGRVTGITLAPGGSGFLPGSRPGSTPVFLAGGLGTTPDARAATAMVEGFFEGDSLALVKENAVVGERINPPSSGNPNDPYLPGGYIASGENYLPSAYRDPFTLGVVAAAQGAIIPVNAKPGKEKLKIWWLRKRAPDSAAFQTFYVPAKVGIYTTFYPENPAKIVLASNAGSGDLSAAELAGSIYYQNDSSKVGYNPNEEHALIKAGRVYALRDDLNITTADDYYTSEPFVLLAYTSAVDSRPAARTFKVMREDPANGKIFNYSVQAGGQILAPMPLAVEPPPIDPETGDARNVEVEATADSAAHASAPARYASFTIEDRKGYHWVYRGPHANGAPSLGMRFFYAMREGFFVPGLATQPAVGAILPYLRPLGGNGPVGDPVTGTPLTIVYRPVWPANAPELRVAETLTLPKIGLPSVLTQTSAEVIYQQSIAVAGAGKPSVVLHDPIREKVFALGASGQLMALPKSVATSDYQGLTYFQGLPPHLQERFYFDPNRGTKGALVFVGKFVDELAGEDYVNLNVLSPDDLQAVTGLVAVSDVDKARWEQAVNGLLAKVETFAEDPLRAGTFKATGTPVDVGPTSIVAVADSDTAVVDYALTATGQGSGWVSMIFGNGRAFTSEGEPVTVEVFKVAPRLYTGDLKVQTSSNPLDEQVSLRHSGDFAAKPDDYEFEWRYSSPKDGGPPPTYSYTWSSRLAANWELVQNPSGALPTAAEYAGGLTTTLPYGVKLKNASFSGGTGRPGLVARSTAGLDFSGGVPARILFSAALADTNAGFVLYVNGVAALAFRAPAPFTNAITSPNGAVNDALALQFEVDAGFFRAAVNQIEVALFTTSDRGADSSINFGLHATSENDLVASPQWTAPAGTFGNQIVVGGSPTAPLGNPLLVMSDNYFTMRYRPKAATNNVAGTGWSRWMPPKLVEGWIKRVLAGINPFNQRIGDLYNNAVNTDVSLLTQAGKRWEGNIALNLQNIEQFGLIEIYETVLNRGKKLTVEAGYDYGPANDALLLAAGYLNDLYTLLGNEAFADAANPTISVDDSATATEVSTSRFSFEGQVKSVLEEELALLRGRDDFLSPGVTVAPGYNRLYWNYTRGINSGEALYAVNYNVREKAGSPTADGKLDAADAQRMFPQAHGDAYGHYLTALKGYTRLLQNPNFTWTPRSESVTVLGQAVQIDYFDERKFASAAVNLGRTAQQVIALTHRQSYKDDPAMGWGHFRDGKSNSSTGIRRQWGLDEWTVRATQGAYFNWMLGNAILPDVDNNPQHTGVQIIDRTTVPELVELTTLAGDFQAKIDSASAFLNPLGLSPNAIAFDISPTELKAGKSHFDQIYARSLRATLNAKGAFDQAARMTRLLRNQENQIGNYNDTIVDQEMAIEDQLIEIYGTPYPGEIGPGKTYAQGYAGPDLKLWFVVDRPSDVVDTTAAISVVAKVPTGVATFTGFALDDITKNYRDQFINRTIKLAPDRYTQFSDQWANGAPMGLRAATGTLQEALLDRYQAVVDLKASNHALKEKYAAFERQRELALVMIKAHADSVAEEKSSGDKLYDLRLVQKGLEVSAGGLDSLAEYIDETFSDSAEAPPKVSGLDNDVTSGVRSALESVGTQLSYGITVTSLVLQASAFLVELQQDRLERSMEQKIEAFNFTYEQAQVVYEYELAQRELSTAIYELLQLATAVDRATAQVRTLIFLGNDLQADREVFRKRAAAIIQGYRTKDLTFRTFRNEALEQYRSLYDLAGRYTYLAAKAYDYETGLLGSIAGQSVINGIVASRALGDLTGGVPQATVSTLGDSGLAGTMARLQADWAVAKPRLGINNPDTNGTLFSLRRELFRIVDGTPGDNAWQQTLEQHIMSNVMADSDVAAACRNLKKPDGSAVPGIVIPFSTTIQHGMNFFGLPSANGDHNFSPSNYATKIYSVGLVLNGYIGMDPYAQGTPNAGGPNTTSANGLNATPYVYLIPTGTDYMLAPPLGDTGAVRAFDVHDQALPLPFNLGATSFSSTQFFNATGTLTEAPWILRKHQAFRPVSDPAFFYSTVPAEFTSSRLVGRSVWNGGWKLVIPAYTLLNAETDGLNRFAASVKDIQLFLRTYSHSGN